MDTGIVEGSTISMYYDPMISKVNYTFVVSVIVSLCVILGHTLSLVTKLYVHTSLGDLELLFSLNSS